MICDSHNEKFSQGDYFLSWFFLHCTYMLTTADLHMAGFQLRVQRTHWLQILKVCSEWQWLSHSFYYTFFRILSLLKVGNLTPAQNWGEVQVAPYVWTATLPVQWKGGEGKMHIVKVRTSGVSWISQDIDSLLNTLSKKCFKMKMRQSFVFLFIYFFNSSISIIGLNMVLDKVIFHVKEIWNTKVLCSI